MVKHLHMVCRMYVCVCVLQMGKVMFTHIPTCTVQSKPMPCSIKRLRFGIAVHIVTVCLKNSRTIFHRIFIYLFQ